MKYRVMICDKTVDIDAESEEDAREKIFEKIFSGEIELSLITWCEE